MVIAYRPLLVLTCVSLSNGNNAFSLGGEEAARRSFERCKRRRRRLSNVGEGSNGERRPS